MPRSVKSPLRTLIDASLQGERAVGDAPTQNVLDEATSAHHEAAGLLVGLLTPSRRRSRPQDEKSFYHLPSQSLPPLL